MKTKSTENNRRPTWRWLSLILVGILIAATSGWGTHVMLKLSAHDAGQSSAERRIYGLESTLVQFQSQLNRIELRLDQVLSSDAPRRGK